MVKLKIGNKSFITPFTIVSHETATKVVLGTSLLVKAKIGLAWKNDQVSLTFGQIERTEFAQAHLAEVTAHNMASIYEIILSPKEFVISSIKHPHAYSKIKNSKNEPALLSTHMGYQDIIQIDEITQSAQNPHQQVRITNISDIGINVLPHSIIATMELLSTFKNTHIQAEVSKLESSPSTQYAKNTPSLDVTPAPYCICKIPNKIFATNPCGNHGISPRWESDQLIQDLTHKDHLDQGGIYTHKSSDPFLNTMYIFCNDQFKFPAISDAQILSMHAKQNLTTTQYNFCFTQPSMYTHEVFKILLNLSNHVPIQTYQITQLCDQCQPFSISKRKEKEAIKTPATILL